MIAKEITSLMGLPVGLSSDLFGNESQIKTGSGKTIPIGELYFDLSKLKIHLQNVGKVAKEGAKKLKKYVYLNKLDNQCPFWQDNALFASKAESNVF